MKALEVLTVEPVRPGGLQKCPSTRKMPKQQKDNKMVNMGWKTVNRDSDEDAEGN